MRTSPGYTHAPTVREAALEVMRERGMTKVFSNPGSTEVPLLTDLPADVEFVLGLHEGSVVGMASGYALGSDRPALVILHTAAGLGNAVNAIAGARDNRVPLVILVGQQDRRQLAMAPFLTGRSLQQLAGDYPVWSSFPARAQDLPGAISRAWNEADQARGPALVVAPMDDWEQAAEPDGGASSPRRVLASASVADEDVDAMAALVEGAERPAIVVGAGTDTAAGWSGVVALAEKLQAPVWAQAFAARAGFPQDHRLFAGHLHWSRRGLRQSLGENDLVLAVGTAAFLLYLYDPGPPVPDGTRVGVITEEPEEANRSAASLALIGPPGLACSRIAESVRSRQRPDPTRPGLPVDPDPPPAGEPLLPAHVFAALRRRLPDNAVLVEETPSSRTELMRWIPARSPLGFLSSANGSLGFGLSASTGLALALRGERPVVAVLGDGSSIYAIQSLWSAAHYEAPLLAVVMANGRYAIMDELAEKAGGKGPWPGFGEIDVATVAEGFGCRARRVERAEELERALDELLPGLCDRSAPTLLQVEMNGKGSRERKRDGNG